MTVLTLSIAPKEVPFCIADSYHHAGDRAKDLVIPPVYQNECHWKFLQKGNIASVTNKLTNKSFELEAPRNAELYLDIAYSYKRCKLRAKNSKFVKDLYMMYEAKFMQASTENLAIKDRTPLKRAPGGNASDRHFGAGPGPPGDVLTCQDFFRRLQREAFAESGHDDDVAYPYGAAY